MLDRRPNGTFEQDEGDRSTDGSGPIEAATPAQPGPAHLRQEPRLQVVGDVDDDARGLPGCSRHHDRQPRHPQDHDQPQRRSQSDPMGPDRLYDRYGRRHAHGRLAERSGQVQVGLYRQPGPLHPELGPLGMARNPSSLPFRTPLSSARSSSSSPPSAAFIFLEGWGRNHRAEQDPLATFKHVLAYPWSAKDVKRIGYQVSA